MPEINLENLFVCQSGADDFTIYGDKSDLNQLALFLSFIANLKLIRFRRQTF